MSKYSTLTESYILSLNNNYYCFNSKNNKSELLILDKKHKDIIESFNSNVITIVIKGRQVGSTTLFVSYITEYCRRNPKTKVLVITPNFNQQKNIFAKIGEAADLSFKYTISQRSANKIVFSNGSEIIDSSKMRGSKKKINIMFVSEMSYLDPQVYEELYYVYDLNRPEKVIVDGTPNDSFFKKFVQKNEYKKACQAIYINYRDTPTIHPNPNEWIKTLQESLDKKAFDQEILGII